MRHKINIIFIFIIFSFSCNTNAKTEISYDSYYNERYDYTINYPTFLIPQKEADSQDGRKFISKDNKSSLLVYYHFVDGIGDNQTENIKLAFNEDLNNYKVSNDVKISKSEIKDNYYKIKLIKENFFLDQTTISAKDMFFTILFEYPKSEENKFKEIIEKVINSFSVGEIGTIEITDNSKNIEIEIFINNFLNECFWGKRFNKLLVENDPTIKKYLDPQFDVKRFYNPGAIPILYTRDESFGFTNNDFNIKSKFNNSENIKPMNLLSPCEFMHDGTDDGVYYLKVNKLPQIVDNETLEFKDFNIPSKFNSIYRIHLVGKKFGLLTLYFAKSENSDWKLILIDESDCSA